MSNENYPDPECEFGIAIQKDISYIKSKLDEISTKQGSFEDTLQNGLNTKVANLHDKVEKMKRQNQEKAEQLEEESKKEKRHSWELKKILVTVFASNVGALIVAVILVYFGLK